MKDILIIGAGASGLYAAGELLKAGCKVRIVEHMDAPGKKLAITGKGRCNLTNNCDEDTFLQNVRRNPRFLYSALHALPPAAVMEVFEAEMRLPLKTERGRRVFPQSDDAKDVVAALVQRAAAAQLVRGRAAALLVQDGAAAGVELSGGEVLRADAVLVATGGLSYPVTGSTGAGYALAQQAGHSIVPPQPSLVALVEKGSIAKRMMGLSLRNVQFTLLEDGKPVFCEQGEMLFTHFGLSGPLVLSASAYVGQLEKHSYEASIDLKPALSPEKLDARLQRDFAEAGARTATHSLDKLLPKTMREVMLERWGVPPEARISQITRAQREGLCALLKDFRIPIAGRGDLAHAVITAGGVNVREVDPKTMQSKCLPRLYFAGEVLDVDGYTGGYNLHIAWCTAAAAARAMAAG